MSAGLRESLAIQKQFRSLTRSLGPPALMTVASYWIRTGPCRTGLNQTVPRRHVDIQTAASDLDSPAVFQFAAPLAAVFIEVVAIEKLADAESRIVQLARLGRCRLCGISGKRNAESIATDENQMHTDKKRDNLSSIRGHLFEIHRENRTAAFCAVKDNSASPN